MPFELSMNSIKFIISKNFTHVSRATLESYTGIQVQDTDIVKLNNLD